MRPFERWRPHNNRRIVDLIYRNNRGRFANLDPQTPLNVGDYGYVDEDTARFMKQGNIFDEHKDYGLGIQTLARIQEVTFYSRGTMSKNLAGDADM